MNWIKFGHAAADCGRGISGDHAGSSRAWAEREAARGRALSGGILARDLNELIARLELTEFDLGGFSLGARTTVEGVGEGLKPRRAILGGAGLEGLRHWQRRKNFFLDAIALFDQVQRGDPHWLSIQFMKSQKVDRVAAALCSKVSRMLSWTGCKRSPCRRWSCADRRMTTMARRPSSPRRCQTQFSREVPGTHMSSVTKPRTRPGDRRLPHAIKKGRPKAPLLRRLRTRLNKRSRRPSLVRPQLGSDGRLRRLAGRFAAVSASSATSDWLLPADWR